MTENVSLFEETRKETNIDGEALWLIGVDTPKGIHCCNGGCSMGSLDLTCECEDNKDVRERTLARMKSLKILSQKNLYNPEELFNRIKWIAKRAVDENYAAWKGYVDIAATIEPPMF